MIAHIYLKKGDDVPRHSHDNEQLTYILEGTLRLWFGANDEREITVRAGEVVVIPSNVPHRALALEDTLDVDVFLPAARRLAEGHGRLPEALEQWISDCGSAVPWSWVDRAASARPIAQALIAGRSPRGHLRAWRRTPCRYRGPDRCRGHRR